MDKEQVINDIPLADGEDTEEILPSDTGENDAQAYHNNSAFPNATAHNNKSSSASDYLFNTDDTDARRNEQNRGGGGDLLLGSKGFESLNVEEEEGESIAYDEEDEKARLIAQVLELQNTLDDLSQKVDNVKEENLRLKSENHVLSQYIDNLMRTSSVFQSTVPVESNSNTVSGRTPE